MDHSGTMAGATGDTEEPSHSTVRGPWLTVARTAWFVVTATALAMHIVAAPLNVAAIAEGRGWRLDPQRAEVLQSMGISVYVYSAHFVIVALLAWIAFMVVAVLIFWHKSHDLVAVVVSLMLISYISTETVFTEVLPGSVWRWPLESMQALGEALSLIVFYIFPDGRFIPRWTRWLAFGYTMLVVLWLLDRELPYNAIYGGTFNKTPIQSTLLAVIVHGTGAFAVGYRFWRTTNPTQRQQIKWVIVGLIVATIMAITRYSIDSIVIAFNLLPEAPARVIYDMTIRPMFWLRLTVVPICFLIAILRFRLWDIDIIINRTLVYGTLTASVIGIYVLAVGGLSVLFQRQGNFIISLFVTGLVAMLFHPLRNRVQQRVNRLMYGDRDEPHVTLDRLGQRLQEALSPDIVLPTIVEIIGQALKIPYVAIELATRDGSFMPVATYGNAIPGTLAVLLVHQRETIGRLILGPRAPGELFSDVDKRSLTRIAQHASVAAYVVRLSLELQQSRERLRVALEEGRRDIRRNLHDGLAPDLASQQIIIDTISLSVSRNPAATADLLRELKALSHAIMANVRRIVDGIRPDGLDELGLIGVLRERIARYSHVGVTIALHEPDVMPPLPAAVEVAAYYIVMEAVNNVVRHAAAHTCNVALTIENALIVSIQDDGRGFPPTYHVGVGLGSMRERATELGGICTIDSIEGEGTHIIAVLPWANQEEPWRASAS